jgi:two-component system OmpR family sensor kinase
VVPVTGWSMTALRRFPIRARLTLAVAGAMTVLLGAVGTAVFWSTGTALLDELDSGLRFRAADIAALSASAPVEGINPLLEERTEAFDQLIAADGTVLRSSPGLARTSLLGERDRRELSGPRFYDRRVAGVQDAARLLAMPVGRGAQRTTLVVGTTMADRADALHHLALVFTVAGPLGVAAAVLVGWWVAGLGLAPVERMRRQADAIDASGRDQRLELPVASDELRRLAATLNQMLDRLTADADHDRAFLELTSHELRTPLTALKAELDLAAAGADHGELTRAVASARDETDRLVRLANDLLALARSRDGRAPVRREPCQLHELLTATAAAHRARALSHGIMLDADAKPVVVHIDPVQVRQALDDLVDNAIRHGGPITRVVLSARRLGSAVEIRVRDDGRGFDPHIGPSAGGLGLTIARTVATSHSGQLTARNVPTGGAEVTLRLASAVEPVVTVEQHVLR